MNLLQQTYYREKLFRKVTYKIVNANLRIIPGIHTSPRSTPAFVVFNRDRVMMPHSMLHFTEDERDYIKLKKVQAFVQHFIS